MVAKFANQIFLTVSIAPFPECVVCFTLENAQETRRLIWKSGSVLALQRSAGFGNSATFLATDTSAKGSWPYVYGSEGRDIQSLTPVLPAYLTLNITGASTNVWNSNTTDIRAMVSVPGSSVRVAADWFSASSFTVEMSFNDGLAHNVAFYCLDWDNLSRTERIDVIDGDTGTLLDTRSIATFLQGAWLVWRFKGHVKLNSVNTTGGGSTANAVLSGFCFDPASVVPPASGGQLFTNADKLIRATGTKSDSTSLNRQYASTTSAQWKRLRLRAKPQSPTLDAKRPKPAKPTFHFYKFPHFIRLFTATQLF